MSSSRPDPNQDWTQTYKFLEKPQRPDEIGRWSSYRVLSLLLESGELWEGYEAVYFSAEDARLNRLVTLKILNPDLRNPLNCHRFLREGRALAACFHDNIVKLHAISEECGVYYFVMEHLSGESLEQRLAREPVLSIRDAVRIGKEAAAGLTAVHARGIIHRDVKPGTIWLQGSPQRALIFDFSLARAIDTDGQSTHQGAITGTPAYLSPEQARGERLDYRSDLFNLGCTLYHMLTGRAPFRKSSAIATLKAVAEEAPTPPQQENPVVPSRLNDLVLELLAKDPAHRPESATWAVQELDAILRDL